MPTTRRIGNNSRKQIDRLFNFRGSAFLRRHFSFFIAVVGLLLTALTAQDASQPYGLRTRVKTNAYLAMPHSKDGPFPPLLSQTGAFKDVRRLIPSDGLIPYDVIVPFWSDGAQKSRWISLPKERIAFAPTGEWKFPPGTVFVKEFELPMDAHSTRRLETRLLVCDSLGGVYGVTYKWRDDNSDADLLSASMTESIPISSPAEGKTQTWYYPSREDCLTCHTVNAGGVLGVKTRQLNRNFTYASGVTDNQLRAWNHVGMFDSRLTEANIPGFGKLAQAGDSSRTVEDRARSYLDANCAQCHRPDGTVAYFDARYDTPLEKQELVNGPVLLDQGIDRARVISPNDIWRSILFMRANSADAFEMPPLAHETVDESSMKLLQQWIQSMPGPRVLDPPSIAPSAGDYDKPLDVTLTENEPGAEIRYTIDGSSPASSDTLYEKPIRLTGPTVIRARAFKPGFTRSITSQAVFIIGG